RFAIGWIIAAVVIGAIGATGGFTSLGHVVASTFPAGFPPRDQAIDANAPELGFGSLRTALGLIVVAGLCWAGATKRLAREAAAVALVVGVGLDLWSIARLYWPFDAPASALYASDPAIDAIRGAKEPGRVLVLDATGAGYDIRDPAFAGDALMSHDIRTLIG